ncbi:MAG: metal ABC transporter substrate-binding protein [Anaerovoracaceae bacterium]
MKKIISIVLITILTIACLSACGRADKTAKTTDKADNRKISVLTTIFPQYDFTRQIAGDQAEVTMLLKPGAESHSYEPTPRDIKRIQNCDLFIYNGGENDVWVDDILKSMGDKKPETLRLVDCVPTVDEELVEGMEPEQEEKDDSGHSEEQEAEKDEHVWTSPKNAIRIMDKITDILCRKDEKNAAAYKENSAAYKEQLQKLDTSFRNIVADAKRRTILFGDRFPFRYFADEYGLKYYAAFTGCSSDTEASAATVAFLTDKVKKEHLPVVFTIELSNGRIADSICEATGAKKMTLYSCHNVTAKQMKDGATYLSMMKKNADSLRQALN